MNTTNVDPELQSTLKAALQEALAGGPSFPDLIARLTSAGITPIINGNTNHVNGISFRTERGTLKGSAIDSRFGWGRLSRATQFKLEQHRDLISRLCGRTAPPKPEARPDLFPRWLFPDAQPVTREQRHQIDIFAWASEQVRTMPELWMLFAIPNEAWYIAPIAYRRAGVRPGVPDLLLAVPRPPYHGLFIELKRPHKSASSIQRTWINKLRQYGYRAEVCRGASRTKALILDYLASGQPTHRPNNPQALHSTQST